MSGITLLDGGMGQELLRRSKRPTTAMWSADIMLNEPHLVRDLHYDFIQAGATVITLNTYTATPSRLARENHLHALHQLHNSAMSAAKEAINKSAKPHIKIAACLPPLVASYKAEASLSFADSLREYKQLVALQAPASDLYICETMSSITEASAACIAAQESGKPVWVALSVQDNASQRLRSGELLQDALQALEKLSPDAVLLNCSKPEAIEASWPLMLSPRKQSVQQSGQRPPFKIGAYANGFTSVEKLYPGDTVEVLQSRKDLDPKAYAKHVFDWIDQGASIVGGCCEIGPAHIAYISHALKKLSAS